MVALDKKKAAEFCRDSNAFGCDPSRRGESPDVTQSGNVTVVDNEIVCTPNYFQNVLAPQFPSLQDEARPLVDEPQDRFRADFAEMVAAAEQRRLDTLTQRLAFYFGEFDHALFWFSFSNGLLSSPIPRRLIREAASGGVPRKTFVQTLRMAI